MPTYIYIYIHIECKEILYNILLYHFITKSKSIQPSEIHILEQN